MGKHDPAFQTLWQILQSDQMVDLVKRITGIPNLEKDPHLHGAGLHYHPRGSRLEMHLDYSIHPITGKERRVNLIVYMNGGWEAAWGGDLHLWEGSLEAMRLFAVRVAPRFNTAALFRTSDESWHGMPDPVSFLTLRGVEGTRCGSIVFHCLSLATRFCLYCGDCALAIFTHNSSCLIKSNEKGKACFVLRRKKNIACRWRAPRAWRARASPSTTSPTPAPTPRAG